MKKIKPIILYGILLHVLLFIVLIKSNFILLVFDKVKVQRNELTSYYHTMVALHHRVDQNLANHSSLFIGDSLTQGLAVSSIIGGAVNYGIGNDTTIGVINRLPYYESITTSNFIILAIGHNDLKYRNIAEIMDNFSLILSYLSPAKNIIVSAILPVDEVVQQNINNKEIRQLNKALEVLSQDYGNVSFINIGKALSKSGGLPSKYHIGDGVHLNKEGNQIWINILKERLSTY
jgi:lysophospholipase L1-like esterase